jgi:hypothetical protein
MMIKNDVRRSVMEWLIVAHWVQMSVHSASHVTHCDPTRSSSRKIVLDTVVSHLIPFLNLLTVSCDGLHVFAPAQLGTPRSYPLKSFG